ncbi:hypothetical protein [Aquimarina litoralis]|uniref:hypothetical protein n=1 Tax=Aquimarina litoralis TaxID=584605 RepID=UPI001C58A8BB|nr:hypothetical protein [Aquimarina litoralis]MBW1297545.1 hypothetical protein [Aquimarina litoralis]
MEIDHIFIFSKNKGKEADDLVNFGFVEGSNRIHKGQGTTNRKFYFKNFFLEVLWVVDQNEIQNDTTSPTKLWERSQFHQNRYSPYGLCLLNSESTDQLFEKREVYQPDYFPKGMSIDMIPNNDNPILPWTFRLPYRNERKESNEPKIHSNKIIALTKAEFEINTSVIDDAFTSYFAQIPNISFISSNKTHLTLEFDHRIQEREESFSELGLTIKY